MSQAFRNRSGSLVTSPEVASFFFFPFCFFGVPFLGVPCNPGFFAICVSAFLVVYFHKKNSFSPVFGVPFLFSTNQAKINKYIYIYISVFAGVLFLAQVKDNLDVMASNVCGAAASVVTACLLSAFMDFVNGIYYAQLLQRGAHRDETDSMLDDILYLGSKNSRWNDGMPGQKKKAELMQGPAELT